MHIAGELRTEPDGWDREEGGGTVVCELFPDQGGIQSKAMKYCLAA